MTSGSRNRLMILGAACSLVLAAVPALVLTDPYKLTGFLVVALLSWPLMALLILGFTLRDPVELPVPTGPRIFPGGFFVVLSAFVYTLVGGLLLGPLSGPFVERAASKEKELVR